MTDWTQPVLTALAKLLARQAVQEAAVGGPAPVTVPEVPAASKAPLASDAMTTQARSRR